MRAHTMIHIKIWIKTEAASVEAASLMVSAVRLENGAGGEQKETETEI